MLMSPAQAHIQSAVTASGVGTVGFFAISACNYVTSAVHAGAVVSAFSGTAVTVGSVASIVAPCLLGGAAVYLPLILLKNYLVTHEELEKDDFLLNNMIDISFLLLAAPLGAYLLGQVVLPVFLCMVFGVLALQLLNMGFGFAFGLRGPSAESMSLDVTSKDTVTAPLAYYAL